MRYARFLAPFASPLQGTHDAHAHPRSSLAEHQLSALGDGGPHTDPHRYRTRPSMCSDRRSRCAECHRTPDGRRRAGVGPYTHVSHSPPTLIPIPPRVRPSTPRNFHLRLVMNTLSPTMPY